VAPIARGKYIGLRKIDAERASWIATARDAEARFERTVYKVDFGRIAFAKLRTPHLEAWRDGLVISKASANRMLTALKAALYLAVTCRAWRHCKSLAGVPGR
jgi:hypothetical protein